MSTINPYRNRQPVVDATGFYGRVDEIEWVISEIEAQEGSSFVGEPGIGKSSLLRIISQKYQTRAELPDYQEQEQAPYLFVFVSLSALPERNKRSFWHYLFDGIVEEAKKAGVHNPKLRELYEQIYRSYDGYAIFYNFEQYLMQVNAKIVILFDNFEIMVDHLGISEADKLRFLTNHPDMFQKLTYVVTSQDPLPQLWQRKEIQSTSPFWNIVLPEHLGLLEYSVAQALIQKPAQKAQMSFNDEDIAFVIRVAGRYPYFIKVASFYLFEAKLKGSVTYQEVQNSIFGDYRLRGLMEQLLVRIKRTENEIRQPLYDTLLAIAQGTKSVKEPILRQLVARGLVDISSGSPKVFGSIFRDFILEQQEPKLEPTTYAMPLDVQFEPKKREVRIGNNQQKLTRLEFKLLYYLAQHTGHVCTRERLKEAIWADSPPKSVDALEQIVRRVRVKIEENPTQPQHLLTIRGKGYMFKASETS